MSEQPTPYDSYIETYEGTPDQVWYRACREGYLRGQADLARQYRDDGMCTQFERDKLAADARADEREKAVEAGKEITKAVEKLMPWLAEWKVTGELATNLTSTLATWEAYVAEE